jgi:peroxiredoxin
VAGKFLIVEGEEMRNVFFIALLSGIIFVKAGLVDNKPEVKLDQKVPNFTLKDYTGKEHTLYDYHRQKGIVVMFIATQCPVSNAYNDRMMKLYKDFAPKGIAFLAINSNKQESVEEITEHSKKYGFEFPVLKDWKNVVADKFDALVTPEIYFIDSTGVLRYHGRIDDAQNIAKVKEHDLREVLEAYLGGKELPEKETRAFGCTIKRVN